MTGFRVLHASDIHLSRTPGELPFLARNESPAKLRAEWTPTAATTLFRRSYDRNIALSFRELVRARINADVDVLLVTGDISTTGDSSDVLVARDFFEGGAVFWGSRDQAYSCTSLISTSRVAFLPGNHDRFVSPAMWPRSSEFERPAHFDDDWRAGRGCASKSDYAKVFVFRKDDERIAICCVDFSLPASNYADPKVPGVWGQGYVTDEALANLLDVTRSCIQRGIAVVWAMHFPPEWPEVSYSMTLHQSHRLIDAAEQMGIRLIMCGHEHKFDDYKPGNGSIAVQCAGTATSYGEEHNTLAEIDIEVVAGTVREVWTSKYSWDWMKTDWLRVGQRKQLL